MSRLATNEMFSQSFYDIIGMFKLSLRSTTMFFEILQNIDWTKVITTILSALLGLSIFIGVKKSNKQVQKSGNNSKNFQANGDINIGGNVK